LFNANSLNEIQWRMTETQMSADKLKLWMKQYKSELNALPENKKSLFFPNYDNLYGLSDTNIDAFVNANYSNIFK
jgi:hypothetical protein